ncbi:glycosyltransferase family 4 protein [Acinetobacter junii]|uniref:glycosyltransferase family 4 protein n=1 Tax=Acinetobacter junii TaxID=40215 RepID=UPI003A8656FF
MSKRVLLISNDTAFASKRGIYYYSNALIKAMKEKYELGLLTQAYHPENSEILESLSAIPHYFNERYNKIKRIEFYFKYFLNFTNEYTYAHNTHSKIITDYSNSIDFFINRPVFYYYNKMYLLIPGLGLHDLKIDSLNTEDIIFTTSPLNIKSSKHKVIQTLHDVIPLNDEYHQVDFNRKIYGLTKADKILAMSNYTKESFLNYYPSLEDKIEVVYQAIDIDENLIQMSQDEHLSKIVLNKYNLEPKKYMFFVGAIEYRKNIHNLIAAFKVASKGNQELKLIIAGKSHGSKYLNEYGLLGYTHEDNIGNIQFIGEISNLEKVCLIRNSRAFLFPSLLEGFGIPVVEAQILGTPVLTSNNSSLTEVAGGSALLVDNPENVEELANNIRNLWSDDVLCNDLSNKGLENTKRFTSNGFANNVNRIIANV